VDWHQPPAKTFAIAIPIGAGDFVFLEDTRGRGHITRLRGGVTNLFIPVSPDFDLVGWARRQGTRL